MALKENLTRVEIINTIRQQSTAEFKERVPLATQENLTIVGETIYNEKDLRNEFIRTLVNRIGLTEITGRSFKNPLKKLKRGALAFGDSVEEIYVSYAKAHGFDQLKAESEVFKREIPDVKTLFHTINRQDFYKCTISLPLLKRAFLSDMGMMSFINDGIIASLYNGDELDEFLIMKNLLLESYTRGYIKTVLIAGFDTEENCKKSVATIKGYSNNFRFPKKELNGAGVLNPCPPENQCVMLDSMTDANVDVNVLASAFNMDKASFMGERILVDDFGGIPNACAILLDRDWFRIYDTLTEVDEIKNTDGLYYNVTYHHHEIMSTSAFCNSVVFVTSTPSVTSVTLTPQTASVAKGGTQQFNVEVVVTNDAPKDVEFIITGTTSPDTTMSGEGLLTVGADELTTQITIIARSKFDSSKMDTSIVTVTA